LSGSEIKQLFLGKGFGLKIEVMRPHELDPALVEAWNTIQNAELSLENPFFSLEFTKAVGRTRDDVFVGVIHDAGKPAGFFPFHLRPFKVGAPIGGPICDYQGVIHKPGFHYTPEALLRGCGLTAYDFNHALAAQKSFSQAAFTFSASPTLDLSQGYDAYYTGRNNTGTKELKNAERKRRKMEREIGPLRFIANDRSPEAWRRLIEWKKASYEQMGVASILDVGWVRKCLEIIRDVQTPCFSGMLSTLYAGDRLAAVHFGMRSATAWHWWFPTYDAALDKYSPGLSMLMEMARWAPDNGVERIDLGRGSSRYKQAFASFETPLCEGSIAIAASLPGALRRCRKLCHSAAKLTGSDPIINFQRRVLNRVLGAGRLGD